MQFFRLIISALLFILITSTTISAQIPAFSRFWATPQLTAPTAMAGDNAYEVTSHYRRQGFEESTAQTFLLSGQVPLYGGANTQFGTLGINLMRDESGASYLFTTSGAMLSYLYDASIAPQHHLVGGVQGGYYWRKIDWSKVTTSNQFVNGGFDPTVGPGEQFSDDPSHTFITNVGLAYYFTSYDGDQLLHVGAAYMNANRGSYNYLINDETRAAPSAFVSYAHLRLISNPYFDIVSDLYWRTENKANDITGGFQLRKGLNTREKVADNHLGIGLYYSQDHTGTLALQLIQPNWLIGIGYNMIFGDIPLGNMQNGVEVSLGWRAIRSGSTKSYGPGKSRRKLPWKNKRRLPWQGR